jgi:hypothetical protein
MVLHNEVVAPGRAHSPAARLYLPKSFRPAWQRQVARLHCDLGSWAGSGNGKVVSLKLLFTEGSMPKESKGTAASEGKLE